MFNISHLRQIIPFGAVFILKTPPISFICTERNIDQKKIESRGWRGIRPRLFCIFFKGRGLIPPAFFRFSEGEKDDYRNEGRRWKKRQGRSPQAYPRAGL
jgi:hypothetical protein